MTCTVVLSSLHNGTEKNIGHPASHTYLAREYCPMVSSLSLHNFSPCINFHVCMYCISSFPCQSRQLLVENAHKEHHEPFITFKFLHFLEAVGRARSEAVASSNMKHHTESDTVVLLQADRFGRSAACCTSQPNHGRRPERVEFASRVLMHEATAPFIIIGLMTLIMASIQNLEQIAAISPFHNIRSCR